MGVGRAEIGMGKRTMSSWQDRWYLSLTGMKRVAPGGMYMENPTTSHAVGNISANIILIVHSHQGLSSIPNNLDTATKRPWCSPCLPLSCCFWLSSPCLALPCRTLTPRVTWTSRRFLFSFKGFPEKGQSTKRKD